MDRVLMESITSMSEYFVAASTRTSFTDLAESGSMSSLVDGHSTQMSNNNNCNSNNGNSSSNNNNNHDSNVTISTIDSPLRTSHNLHETNLNQQFAGSPPIGAINKPSLSVSNQQMLNHQQHNHTSCNQHQDHLHNNHSNLSTISPHSQCGHSHNHYSNHGFSAHSGTQTKLSQPMRTQIPIHCYIEQLDACADIHSYSSSLNDIDLFNNTNKHQELRPVHPVTHSQSQLHHHPHLHQSKLALESVTDCNGAPASLASIANTNSLFIESETNNDDNDLDSIDAHLDHLSSNSSLSIHQQTSVPSNIQTNTSQQASSSFDNHRFQACRETYAIVTSNILYIDLVRTVLLQLGYSAMDLINAKATIQIKNWRPLALDQVTEDKRATVGEVLGDISTFVTLRIRLYSSVKQLPTEWTETMIRQVVLALTQTMSQLTLSKLCNISQPLISSIVRGGKKLGRRKCAEFGQWYMNYIKSVDARPSTMFCEGGGARLVFDKSREIPQLKAWFANNTKPSDELLEEYSKILNEHALRKDRPQVTAKTLKNWWKNERQKLGIRQREIRGRPKLKRAD